MFMRTILTLSLVAFAIAIPVAQEQGIDVGLNGIVAGLGEILDNL